MHFLQFFYGLIAATAAIAAAEIVFDYSLGDYLKDLVVGLFRGAEGKVRSQLQRAEARYKSAVSKIKTRTGLKAL
jgi:hypothetical protein